MPILQSTRSSAPSGYLSKSCASLDGGDICSAFKTHAVRLAQQIDESRSEEDHHAQYDDDGHDSPDDIEHFFCPLMK